MSLKQVPNRWDPEAYELVSRAAGHLGISAAEFIRTAAVARAAFTLSRYEPGIVEQWDELYACAAVLARENPPVAP